MKSKKYFSLICEIIPTLFILSIVIVLWEIFVRATDIESYILPAPSDIARSTFFNLDILATHARVTLLEAIGGLLCATILGISTALALKLFPKLDKSIQPIIAGLQSFPKEAIAPLLIVWFGFGITSKFIIATSIAFFPIFLSSLQGLKGVPKDVIDTFTAFRASQIFMLLKVRFPYSLPSLFSGLRVASTLSLVGAVIGEFVGSSAGLGHLTLVANSQFSVDLVFSCLFILGLMGIFLDFIIQLIARKVICWHESISIKK